MAELKAASASSNIVSSRSASAARRMFGACARVAGQHLRLKQYARSAAMPFAFSSSQRRRARSASDAVASGFRQHMREDHRADVAAVQNRAALGAEAALEVQQRRARARN